MSSTTDVSTALAGVSEANADVMRPGSATDLSARDRSLRLLKKKLGAAASKRNKGSAAVVPPSPRLPAAGRPMDSEAEDPSGAAPESPSESTAGCSGHENPVMHQREEEARQCEPEEIPIAALRQRQQALVVMEKRGGKRPVSNVSRPVSSCSGAGAGDTNADAEAAVVQPPSAISKTLIKWSCRTCERECIPIREESRCLCGHRYKEHPSAATDPRVKDAKRFRAFACTSARCACPGFFYVVAEGAWVLRCRCKHKHVDHDASRGPPFACTKPKCACAAFDSPWVCNCDHPWAEHAQEVVTRQLRGPLALLETLGDLDELTTVLRTDLLAEPLQLRL